MSWDELVAAALIGTDRRPVGGRGPEGSPPGLADTLAAREAEDRLLGAAAAWTVARRAGAVAGRARSSRAAPGPDERPLAPGTRLQMMLEGTFPSLLPEWLELVAERGLRPPPELVPACSTTSRAEPALHAAVGAAAGPLGPWLAARAPRWGFVHGAGDDVEAVWADGERAERRRVAERLRRREPAAARELLAATFAAGDVGGPRGVRRRRSPRGSRTRTSRCWRPRSTIAASRSATPRPRCWCGCRARASGRGWPRARPAAASGGRRAGRHAPGRAGRGGGARRRARGRPPLRTAAMDARGDAAGDVG